MAPAPLPKRGSDPDAQGAPEPQLAWVGNNQQYRWLHGIVAAVIVLNAIDAVLTVLWVRTGLAIEGNPLLADLVLNRPVAFVLFKMTLVSLGTWILWRRRNQPLAVIGIFMLFMVYDWLLLVHLRAFQVAVLDDVLRVLGLP